MQVELIDICNYMVNYLLFDEMLEELFDWVVGIIEVEYFWVGKNILEFGKFNYWFYYICSGVVEIYWCFGEFYNCIGEGEIFGQFGLLMYQKVWFFVKVLEDILIYCFFEEIFCYLFENDDNFVDFVEVEDNFWLCLVLFWCEKLNEFMIFWVICLIFWELVLVFCMVCFQEVVCIMIDQGVLVLLFMDE